MKLIFVSSPRWSRHPTQIEANISRAVAIGAMINQAGKGEVMAVVPHLLGPALNASHPMPEDFWRAGMIALMQRCNGVVFTPDWDTSAGCRGERKAAIGMLTTMGWTNQTAEIEAFVNRIIKQQ